MALDIINPIQNTSYVNRDFESVYAELLDLVKELTYKWDPSISNESDPGVILLKLNAIIADKLSYNLDKNILECFPLSVTQEGNARQLFEQLGYYMKWYRGATTNVALKWISTPNNNSYTIPAFTMVSDYDSTVVYSLVGPVVSNTQLVVGDLRLPGDGTIITARAIQGIPVKYDINGETLVRYSALDSNKRLYFNSSDIAQNGIFITNRDMNNYSSWVKVDNLTVQSVSDNDRYFKFGVTTDGTTCYLEFPDNAESLFGEGIEITYIRTLGSNGNVAPRVIEKFYQDVVPVEDTGLILNTDNTIISNISSASNGADPETINQAYRGYKRTIGTFDTLVTLRDYFNYIVNAEGLVSNAIVTDRTNDIQSTYKIVSQKNLIHNAHTEIEIIDDKPAMTAYSLKLYLLKYQGTVNDGTSYNATFNMMNNAEKSVVEAYMQDTKSIQHDYEKILATDPDNIATDPIRVCYFIDKYPVNCSVTTQYSLTSEEASEVTNNIKIAIYKQLNSQEIDFGEEVPIDLIKTVILGADKRIKDVTFNTMDYTTYAIYYTETSEQADSGNGEFRSIAINGDAYEALDVNDKAIADRIRSDIYAKSVLAGITQFYVNSEIVDCQLGERFIGASQDAVVINNIEKIISGVDIAVSDTEATSGYTIRDNEVIQFFAPNLIDSASYSNFVKFEYNGPTVSKNNSYKLTSSEFIIFYWKSDNDSVYNYTTYSEGCIIKPSFDLSPQDSTPVEAAHQQTLFPNITGNYDQDKENYTITNGMYVRSSAVFGEIDASTDDLITTRLISSNYVLSGTKKVIIQSMNKVTLSNQEDNPYYCYWILNSSEVDSLGISRYVLFDSTETVADRMLDTGEYFFYTNAEMTQLTVLGSGTTISRNSPDLSNEWSVVVKDSTAIMQNGMAAFDPTDWYQLKESESCELVENQYYNFGSGASVKLTEKSGATNPPTEITREVQNFSDFDIQYKSQGTTAWTTLPDINLGQHGGWQGRSLLNLFISPTQEQKILDGQYVSYHIEGDMSGDDEVWTTIDGADLTDQSITNGGVTETLNYYPVVLRSKREVSISGAEVSNQEVHSLDSVEYLTIYKYARSNNLKNAGGDIIVSFNDDGKVIVKIVSGGSTVFIPARLLAGEYTIPVHIPSGTGSTSIKVTADNNLCYEIFYKNADAWSSSVTYSKGDVVSGGTNNVLRYRSLQDSNTNNAVTNASYWEPLSDISSSGMHYLYKKIDTFNGSSDMIFKFVVTGNTEEFNIQVNDLYRFVYPDNIDDEEIIENQLFALDPNELFNYTYEVDPDIVIETPLDPMSFLDPYHVYNKFTICQFDTDNSVFKILNKR